MADESTLEDSYDDYPRIEEAFLAVLDESLNPRGPELLYDLVRDFPLPARAAVIDVGCGEGKHALQLAERFDFVVRGIDPVARHVEVANDALRSALAGHPELNGRVRFELGAVEALPLDDASADLVWCRDVLSLVADLDRAYAEFRRVLRSSGRAVVYQSLMASAPFEIGVGERTWPSSGVVATSTDPARTEAAIAQAGFHVDACLDVGMEFGEWTEEHTGRKARALIHLARLQRDPDRYITQFGQTAYDIMLGDCFWHVDHMTGKYRGLVYVLS